MKRPKFYPADIISTPGIGTIRWMERYAYEPPSYAGHSAIIGPDKKYDNDVIEALWTVTATPVDQWFVQTPHCRVYRHMHLDYRTRQDIAKVAENYLGRKYGWWKLAAHLGDCLLSKGRESSVYFFRKLLFLDDYPVCSWVVGYSYWSVLGYDFCGVNPAHLQPDDIDDFCMANSAWKLVYQK